MPKRSSKTKDVNQIAAEILAEAIGEPHDLTVKGKKNPAAVALGRMGGLRGGKARARNLTAAQLAEIGKKGAAARWKDKKVTEQPEGAASSSPKRRRKKRHVIQVQED